MATVKTAVVTSSSSGPATSTRLACCLHCGAEHKRLALSPLEPAYEYKGTTYNYSAVCPVSGNALLIQLL